MKPLFGLHSLAWHMELKDLQSCYVPRCPEYSYKNCSKKVSSIQASLKYKPHMILKKYQFWIEALQFNGIIQYLFYRHSKKFHMKYNILTKHPFKLWFHLFQVVAGLLGAHIQLKILGDTASNNYSWTYCLMLLLFQQPWIGIFLSF